MKTQHSTETQHTPGPWIAHVAHPAASPDLLAALEEITDLAYQLAMASPKLNPSVDRIIPAARAAIAKAKGCAP